MRVVKFPRHIHNSTKRNKIRINIDKCGLLKTKDFRARSSVSIDCFESRLNGRIYNFFGETTPYQYIRGYVFVDQMSGYIHI